MTLGKADAVTNHKKNYLLGKMIATFALGSKKRYDFLHCNQALEIHPIDFTNNPYFLLGWAERQAPCHQCDDAD